MVDSCNPCAGCIPPVMGDDYFKQALIAILCDFASGGGNIVVEGEPLVLCDTVQEFLRHIVYTNGVVSGVTNTLLDGTTPYVPVGAVQLCAPTVALDVTEGEPLVLCDTVQQFLRHIVYTNGVVSAVNDTQLDGTTPYAVVGAVSLCPQDTTVTNNPVPYAAPADTRQFDTGPFSSVADQVLFPAVVGMRNYVTTVTLSNSSLTLERFLIKDGATVIHSVYVDAQVAVTITLPVPLRSSVNTAINVATASAITNALAAGVGYISAT